MIPFNKLFHTDNELTYIGKALQNGKIAGDGPYTQLREEFFEEKFGFKKALLTSSCTDALEMCALLIDLQPGDEIIMPSSGLFPLQTLSYSGAQKLFLPIVKKTVRILMPTPSRR